MSALSYYREIDGLRVVPVTLIVLFHLQFWSVSGAVRRDVRGNAAQLKRVIFTSS